MKRLFPCLLLLAFLLAGCRMPQAAVSSTATTAAAPSLVGVWVNAGQYSEGRDFVETMTLRGDGSVTVHLDYQGKDYATLEGRWTAENGVLSVDFTDHNTKDRTYSYALSGTTLTLTGDGKDVTYQQQN